MRQGDERERESFLTHVLELALEESGWKVVESRHPIPSPHGARNLDLTVLVDGETVDLTPLTVAAGFRALRSRFLYPGWHRERRQRALEARERNNPLLLRTGDAEALVRLALMTDPSRRKD